MKLLSALSCVLVLLIAPSFGKSIYETAKETPSLSTFASLLERAGYDDYFDCDHFWCHKLTVFAPSNDAFSKLDQTLVRKLTDENNEYLEHLRQLLLYHVVQGQIFAEDIENGSVFHSLQGDNITVSVNAEGAVLLNSDVPVVEVDIEASNGVIHIVDSVLTPSFLTKNIVQVAQSYEAFSSLVEAVSSAGLVDALSGSGPFTVFAPTNDAFAKLGLPPFSSISQADLSDILQYHVIGNSIVVKAEVQDGSVTMLNGDSIEIKVSKSWWGHTHVDINNKVRIQIFNVLANNGVIHVIDTVLVPPDASIPVPSIADIVAATDNLQTLAAALQAADLVGTIGGDGPFTVFAPTDDAFAELGEDTVSNLLLTENKASLTSILTYHVIGGAAVFSEDLVDGPVATLNAAEIQVQVRGHYIILNGDTYVIRADVEASNGVIHIIDKVLIPPEDLVATATKRGYNTLVAAVAAAGLTDALTTGGPFTLFAPTDAAFEKSGRTLEDPNLADVLKYHVVNGRVAFADLKQGAVPTLRGESIQIKFQYWLWWIVGVRLNDSAQVKDVDVFASNGIIHQIDTVLIPPSLRGR